MNIRNFMQDNGLRYLLVNSTNEFLVEYNSLAHNSRYKLTNFSGSTGDALVTPDTIFLFVDGRYHIQADMEVNQSEITVVKLQAGQVYIQELIKKIPEYETLGLFSKKNSQAFVEELSAQRQLKFIDNDPFDQKDDFSTDGDVELELKYTGVSSEDKISNIAKNLSEDEAIYISDLDEVSYLFNMRNYTAQPYSAKIKAKALIMKDNAILFIQDRLKNYENFLRSIKHDVYVDKNSINAYDYGLLGSHAQEMRNNPVKLMKAQKNEYEIEHLKDAFTRTDNVMHAIRDYIENNDNISEFDIALRLVHEFKNQGAVGLSFAPIVAKDKNSALAHYLKCSKNEMITEGSLVLIDCGGYFSGGLATDITRVFVKGEPSAQHKKIYTIVLKAFLNAYNYPKINHSDYITGFDIDNYIREFFNNIDTEGFIFNHGLGHGIGVNVHEYPPKLSSHEISKVPLLDGECFSIEPGLYCEGKFGVRLENSCYYKGGAIKSFVKMNFEKKLIDYDLLSQQEKEWLMEFEVR